MFELYGSIEKITTAYDSAKEIRDLYLQDYERYYNLSKLARETQEAIDETDNLKGKKELNKLLEKINSQKAEGLKLTEYDIDALEK